MMLDWETYRAALAARIGELGRLSTGTGMSR